MNLPIALVTTAAAVTALYMSWRHARGRVARLMALAGWAAGVSRRSPGGFGSVVLNTASRTRRSP